MSFASLSAHYRSLLRECSRAAALREGQKIHALLLKNGVAAAPSAFIHNALLHLYAACACTEDARMVFDQIPHTHRDAVDWTTLMTCYTHNHLPSKTMHLFRAMQQDVPPDEVTMITLFGSCAQLGDAVAGAQVHLRMIKTGLPFTPPACNAAMDMYAKCGIMNEARRMFQQMPSPTVVSWTVILTGSLKWESLSDGRQLFDQMPERNEFSWTVMIAAYVEQGFPSEATLLLSQMLRSLPPLNHVSLCSILSSCSLSGDLNMGRWIHAYVVKTTASITQKDNRRLMASTALVDMYVKCGRIDVASRVFYQMTHRNVVTWNAMLSGLAMHGQGHVALRLFDQMVATEAKPDDITFVAVLSACSHSGLVEEGWQYFHALCSKEYGVKPKVEHYACMVDILGRAGLVEEAEVLVRKMPVPPNEVVLGALLASCSFHGKIPLGERLLKELLEMDPLNTQYHVLLSNMYMSVGRQDKSDVLRLMLKEKGIQKTPGMSCIHVDGHVYWFSAGDKSHPQASEVYAKLDEMIQQLRTVGYMPAVCLGVSSFM